MQKSTRLVRDNELVTAELDGDTVMMHVESGNYFSLNPVGASIWDLLETPNTVATVIAHIENEFDRSEGESSEAEFTNFLSEMLENSLIYIVES